MAEASLRHLVIVLGDQLDLQAAAFDGFDPTRDAVWMAEVAEESTQVWSSQPRIALFLSAMRHFAQALLQAGRPLHYMRLDQPGNHGTLAGQLAADVLRLRPAALVMTAPGDWRVFQAVKAVAADQALPLDVREDRHFYATVREFAAHARGRRQLRLEYWYRELRRKHGVLMEAANRAEPADEAGDATAAAPAGGRWNFDSDNRAAFGPAGPTGVPPRVGFAPDAITRDVLAVVRQRFSSHPGVLERFDWPVTRADALVALQRFIDERLAAFGPWQDAMWPNQPWLYHSQLSAALNLKLLGAREVVDAAEAAWRSGRAPLASVEGFIRQVLGWREYVRGLYWTQMPGYLERNALQAHEPLPGFYWHGRTPMACLADAIGQTLATGYAHHIQRLMLTGLYALLLGVQPKALHAWYLAVYVDAVEWVELPNTLGMSQYADGGLMASKPYVASGKYIQRMGGHCAGCRFDPGQRTGERACPFTTLYWDFLRRHEALLAANPRMVMQVRNLARLDDAERERIAAQAQRIRRDGVA